jgi:hypothetical protein
VLLDELSVSSGLSPQPGGLVREIEVDASAGGAVTVPDAQLLFQGEYRKLGFDLVIEDGATRLTIHDYFRVGNRPTLQSPDGASLSDAVVEALALSDKGERTAQAGPPPGQTPIGRVESVSGSATAIRNGVSVALNTGDAVYKGDAVQTDRGGSLALVFLDGSTFSLSSSARMVLNDMVYSPGASGNTSLLSIVQGSISFVAGQVAKTGDMRVDTPVATMGIRGTAPKVDVLSENGPTRFSVMREPNGEVGSFVLYSKTDPTRIVAVVASNEIGVEIAPNGTVNQFIKSPAEIQAETAIVQRVFDLFTAAQQNLPGQGTQQGSRVSPGPAPGGAGPGRNNGTPTAPNLIGGDGVPGGDGR